jgi:excisionase family DNA binding protein
VPSGQPEREYLTIQQAADYLRVSRRTILRRLRDGTLTRYQMGGAVRVDRAQLDWRMERDGDEMTPDEAQALADERKERD